MVLISVVIPTYHRSQLLRKCLASLRVQSCSFFEVIVVSDGPDEETKKLMEACSSRDSRFRYLQLPRKKGPAAARNFGWKQAKGKLVAFTDDDTLPDALWLEAFLQVYKNEPEIAYTGKVKVPVADPPTDYEKNTAGLETAGFVTANCCCTKKALEKTGGFDERFSMAWREDSDLEFQLMLHRIPIVHVEEALVVHPVRKAPWGVSIKEQKKGMFNALLYKKYPDLYRIKIQPAPLWNYYLMVVSGLVGIAALLWQWQQLAFTAFVCWLVPLVAFIIRRLGPTSKKPLHVLEMILTSICIPFISVYWHLYGAWRYRVFFL